MTGPSGKPLRAGASVIDVMGGMFGVIAILAALQERNQSGEGQQVMSSLYELERENILERTEMGRKMYVMNGGKLGRKVGTTENRSDFLKKEKTQKIISLLEKGKSVRDISGRLGVSTKTIVKVRKYIELV